MSRFKTLLPHCLLILFMCDAGNTEKMHMIYNKLTSFSFIYSALLEKGWGHC